MKIDIRDIKVIWFFFRSHKLQSLGVLGFIFISGTLETLNLAALYPIVNYGLSLEKKDFFLRHFDKVVCYISPGNPLFAACVFLIIISVLAVAAKLICTYSLNKLLIRISGEAQKKIFERLSSVEYDFYVNNQQGKLIFAGVTAPERMSLAILSTIMLAYYFINALFLFFLLIFMSWQGTFFILILGLLYSFATKELTYKFIHKWALIRVEEWERKNIIFNELITGIKSIKIFLAVGEWKKRYINSLHKSLTNYFRILTVSAFPEVLVKFMFLFFLALSGIFLSQRPHSEIISLLPVFGIFVVVVTRFLPSANGIGSSMMKIVECMPDTKIVYEFCKEEVNPVATGEKIFGTFKDKIVFENVWFKYNNMADYLLKDLSFSVERKKMTALVGLSGAGKTTIINLLLKLYRVDKGTIKIDGEDILELHNNSYLSKIGYVSQETFIFNASFKENIRFGMEYCTDQMIEEAAKLANADDFIKDTPDGYDTLVGDSGIKLSGGQKQRVAIARAMLRKPQIIIFDEATSSLDNISEKNIQNAINNISKYTTVLVIAHRLSTIENADKIIILDKGEIREQGTHEELLRDKSLYYDLYTSKDNNLIQGEHLSEALSADTENP